MSDSSLPGSDSVSLDQTIAEPSIPTLVTECVRCFIVAVRDLARRACTSRSRVMVGGVLQLLPHLDVMSRDDDGAFDPAQIAQALERTEHRALVPTCRGEHEVIQVLPQVDGILGEDDGPRIKEAQDERLRPTRVAGSLDEGDGPIAEDVVVALGSSYRTGRSKSSRQ